VIVANNHFAEQGLSLLIMDLSKKDRVEDAYKVKEKLIKLSQQKQRFVIVCNNHFAVIT
jgi:hypothetical protein